MNYDELIKDILKKRGMETDAEMDAFLHPSAQNFHNPFLLSGMKAATERIDLAIKEFQKIIIYGDYDCDGICAVSILYDFLTSVGADVVGFIPSRHTDGYGLSPQTVEFLVEKYHPSLVITVDTGISAAAEVELLKSKGVDVIVTDHHEPPQNIPNAIVVDPKVSGQDYPFCGLSGAGVAFKLVQAMAGLEKALTYADIAAISTVGDIVPLTDENRALVKFGLKAINSKSPRPSIGYIKSKLKLKTLNSTDIAFKIVPRLNACGRISTAEKCYKFMLEQDGNKLSELYREIEADNDLRLSMSAEIMTRVDEELHKADLNSEPAVFIRDDDINLGLIGIVASRLVNTLNRPVFVVTSDEEGNLKASVRSIEGINIFSILDKFRHLMIDVGGHSLAGGLTISPQNYEELKTLVNYELKKLPTTLFHIDRLAEVDAELSPSDINMALARRIEELEPFGYGNPRPVFLLQTNSTEYTPMKSYKHYKIGLSKSAEVVSFFGEKIAPYFNSAATKKILFTLEVDKFFAAPRAKALLKSVVCDEYQIDNETEFSSAKELFYLAGNIGGPIPALSTHPLPGRTEPFGTVIVINNGTRATKIAEQLGLRVVLEPQASGESVVVYNPRREIDPNSLNMYHVAYVEDPQEAIAVAKQILSTTLIGADREIEPLGLTREVFKACYIALVKALPTESNNFFECVEMLVKSTKLSPRMITAVIMVGVELGFFGITQTESGSTKISVTPGSAKKQLEESKLYNQIK